MGSKFQRIAFALVVGAGLCMCPGLKAQTTGTGTITGTVTDSSGAVVPGVHVTVTQMTTEFSRSTNTNGSGYYVFSALPIGEYEITATIAGFNGFDRRGVELNADSNLGINITLRVGATTQAVTVNGAPPPLNTTSGAVDTLVTGLQVQDLALNGRNFTQLLTLGPGVASEQTGLRMGVGQEGNPLVSVNGGSVQTTMFTYDGVIAMDTAGLRGLDLFPPMEAIQEVQIHKSNYSADNSSFGFGQVNVVMKSGGQEYHGSVYEVNGNSAFDARNFFSSSVSPLNQNMFGFTLGGPVLPSKASRWHDRVHFFYSQAWNRRIGPQIASFVAPPQGVFTAETPTAAERQGDFSSVSTPITDPVSHQPFPGNIIPPTMIDSNARILAQQFFPLPNSSGAPNFVYSTDSNTDWREELGRVDLQLTRTMSLMVRYIRDNWTQDQNILAPSSASFSTNPGLFLNPGQGLVLNLTNILSPVTVNQLIVGYSRKVLDDVPTAADRQPAGLTIPSIFNANAGDIVPTVSITGYGGISAETNSENIYNTYTYRDDFSRQLNNHSLGMGVEWIHPDAWNYDTFSANQSGTFTFNGQATGNPLADFLLGDAFEYTEGSAVPSTYLFANDYEMYVEDDWKARPNLTLNFGLRNSIMGSMPNGAEKYGHISTFVPSFYSPIDAPIVIASNGRLVPGTGNPLNGIITPFNQDGLHLPPSMVKTRYDNLGPRVGFAWSPHGSQKIVLRGGYGIFYGWAGNQHLNMSQNPPFAQSASIFNTDLSNPTQGANALFPPSLIAEDPDYQYPMVQQWSLTVERRLGFGTVLSVAYVGNYAVHNDQTFNINQPQPNLAVAQSQVNINAVRPFPGYAGITYDTRNASSRYNGLQVDARRHFAHDLMFEAAYTWSRDLCWSVGQNTLLQQNEEGLCALDQPQNFSLDFVYDLPFFRTQQGKAGKVLGGWELSGITTYASGFPFTITESGNRSGTGNGGRPNLVGQLNIQPGNVTDYFNTAAFALQPLGQFGNEGANVLRGPGREDWGLSLYKNTHVRLLADKRGTLKLGVETYNLFNQVSFSAVGTVFGSPTFGHLTSALDPREADLRIELSF